MTSWTDISPAVYRTLLTHWAQIAHVPLQSLVYAKLGWAKLGRNNSHQPPPDCLRDNSQTASLYRISILCHPTPIPAARSLSGPSPTTQSTDFCQIGHRYLQISKEEGRIILMQVLFISLLVKHPRACITGEASKPKTDTYRSKTR